MCECKQNNWKTYIYFNAQITLFVFVLLIEPFTLTLKLYYLNSMIRILLHATKEIKRVICYDFKWMDDFLFIELICTYIPKL